MYEDIFKEAQRVNARLLGLEQASRQPQYNAILKGAYSTLVSDVQILYRDYEARRLRKPKNAKEARAVERIIKRFNSSESSTLRGYKGITEKTVKTINNKFGLDISVDAFQKYADSLIFGDFAERVGYRAVIALIKEVGFDKYKKATEDKSYRDELIKSLDSNSEIERETLERLSMFHTLQRLRGKYK